VLKVSIALSVFVCIGKSFIWFIIVFIITKEDKKEGGKEGTDRARERGV
jgi:hypothetical protein